MTDFNDKIDSFCFWSEQPLEKLAAAKKKSKKSKKQVAQRSRGKCVFPAKSSRLKDHSKDRYPINNINEARAALRYAGKQKSAPWFKGTVEEMRKAVENAVHKAFPALKHEKKKSKKSDLEISSFEKQGIMKERMDAEINKTLENVDHLKNLAESTYNALNTLKSQYSVHFDPNLEHTLSTLLSRSNVSDCINKIQEIRHPIKSLLEMAHYNKPE
jgi:hypothetical protein